MELNPKTYISSTSTDLGEYRQAVRDVLDVMGFPLACMEKYQADSRPPLEKCLADVAESDLYIGIFARHYGSIPKDHEKSFTELEYRTAVEHGIPTLIFLLKEGVNWPERYCDTGENTKKLQALRDELSSQHTVVWFSSANELALKVSLALGPHVKRVAREVFQENKKTVAVARSSDGQRFNLNIVLNKSANQSFMAKLDRVKHKSEVDICLGNRWPSRKNKLFLLMPGLSEGGQDRFMGYVKMVMAEKKGWPELKEENSIEPDLSRMALDDQELGEAELKEKLYEGFTSSCYMGDLDRIDQKLSEIIQQRLGDLPLLVHYHFRAVEGPRLFGFSIIRQWEQFLPKQAPCPIIVAITWPLPERKGLLWPVFRHKKARKVMEGVCSEEWKIVRLPDFEYFRKEEIMGFLTGEADQDLELTRPEAERWLHELKPETSMPATVYKNLERKIVDYQKEKTS